MLYTSIGANIDNLTAARLAALAVESARAPADGQDGISYLIHAKGAGIRTNLSDAYEVELKRVTGADSLEEALAQLHTGQ